MKNLLPALLIITLFSACKKDTMPPPGGSSHTVTPVDYSGSYLGLFYKHVAGVDSNGVYKYDTTYAYTVTITQEGLNTIGIHGETEVASIEVNDTGYFELKAFNRNIEGHFDGDSLHIFSDAIGGSYDPPQWYSNTQMKFDGKKQ